MSKGIPILVAGMLAATATGFWAASQGKGVDRPKVKAVSVREQSVHRRTSYRRRRRTGWFGGSGGGFSSGGFSSGK